MKLTMLEIGKIVNTHGVRGEIKVQPWCDDAKFLCSFDTYYLGGQPVRAVSKRIHKDCALMQLEGIDTMEKAEALKGEVLSVRREDAKLEEGRWFNGELIGLSAINEETGAEIGTVRDVLVYPASNILDIKGAKHYLVPAISQFMRKVDLDAGTITLHILEGMADDEN